MNYVLQAWRELRACIDQDMKLFFPRTGKQKRTALSYCMVCPVSTECLQYAIDNEIQFGIWGGKTEDERKVIVRSLR